MATIEQRIKEGKGAKITRTITKTIVTVTAEGKEPVRVELAGDIPVGKATAKVKALEEFAGVEGLSFGVTSEQELRGMTVEEFVEHSKVIEAKKTLNAEYGKHAEA